MYQDRLQWLREGELLLLAIMASRAELRVAVNAELDRRSQGTDGSREMAVMAKDIHVRSGVWESTPCHSLAT